MSGRQRVEWAPDVREDLLAGVGRDHVAALEAETRFKIRVYLAVKQGLTTREVAEALGISQTAVSKYRMQGEAAYRDQPTAEE